MPQKLHRIFGRVMSDDRFGIVLLSYGIGWGCLALGLAGWTESVSTGFLILAVGAFSYVLGILTGAID